MFLSIVHLPADLMYLFSSVFFGLFYCLPFRFQLTPFRRQLDPLLFQFFE